MLFLFGELCLSWCFLVSLAFGWGSLSFLGVGSDDSSFLFLTELFWASTSTGHFDAGNFKLVNVLSLSWVIVCDGVFPCLWKGKDSVDVNCDPGGFKWLLDLLEGLVDVERLGVGCNGFGVTGVSEQYAVIIIGGHLKL